MIAGYFMLFAREHESRFMNTARVLYDSRVDANFDHH